MKFEKEIFQFNSFNEKFIESLISHIYNKEALSEVFFCGTAPSLSPNLERSSYLSEMKEVFNRVVPEIDFETNQSYFASVVDLKSCFSIDVYRLIGHYYDSFIYIPKKGISIGEFALAFKKKRKLKNYFRTPEYKAMIDRYYYIFPEHAYFVEYKNLLGMK